MSLRKRLIAGAVLSIAACAAYSENAAPAQADEPLAVSPAVYRSDSGPLIQLVHRGYGWGGYGWGGGYRPYYGGGWGYGVGVYRPAYRPYPGFGVPVYSAPVYGAPVYGYPAYGYPRYGYGYGYGGCW